MAKTKPTRKKSKNTMRGRRKSALPAVLTAILLCVGGLFGWMGVCGNITHLKQAELYLADLPSSFDGTTILYLSDLNIRGGNDSAACIRLMDKLSSLNADMLLLGGDYSAPSAMEALNGVSGGNTAKTADFIAKLADFYAPLGKFAVCGENDDANALDSLFASSGVQLLQDYCVQVKKNGESIIIAGLSDVSANKTPYEKIGGYFTGKECVIAAAHNPSAYVGIRVAEANGGGAWADAVLCGHTLGGQIKIGERTLRSLAEAEKRCISGWYYENDLPMLVSQGLGCPAARLRLGSESEVWLITLRKQENQQYILPKL